MSAGPRTVAIIDLLRMTTDQARATFGGARSRDCLCYRLGDLRVALVPDPDDAAHRMTRVTVGGADVCDHPLTAKSSGLRITTERGIGIGASEEQLVRSEGRPTATLTPEEVSRTRSGPLNAAELRRLGDVEFQYARKGEPVVSVFLRNHRVTAIAAWIPD